MRRFIRNSLLLPEGRNVLKYIGIKNSYLELLARLATFFLVVPKSVLRVNLEYVTVQELHVLSKSNYSYP